MSQISLRSHEQCLYDLFLSTVLSNGTIFSVNKHLVFGWVPPRGRRWGAWRTWIIIYQVGIAYSFVVIALCLCWSLMLYICEPNKITGGVVWSIMIVPLCQLRTALTNGAATKAWADGLVKRIHSGCNNWLFCQPERTTQIFVCCWKYERWKSFFLKSGRVALYSIHPRCWKNISDMGLLI